MSRQRSAAHIAKKHADGDHRWRQPDGSWAERAGLMQAEAQEACERIEALTGWLYWSYPCRGCGLWHIRLRKGATRARARVA